MEVISGADELVHDFADEYPVAHEVFNGVEGAPSSDMRWWAFQVCNGMTPGGQCEEIQDVIVYDRQADTVVGRLSEAHPGFPTPNFVDISPSGSRVVVGSCAGNPPPFDGMYAWTLDFSASTRLNTSCAHSGWAWGKGGEELFVSSDPCGEDNDEVSFTCDHIMAVDVNDPEGWARRIPILHHEDIGWGVGVHLGRIYDPGINGWVLLSTYGEDGSSWAANQIFFVETRATAPRIWRISPALNAYQGYWSEAFASLDFSARNVYWGANWGGTDNLELYQARLCDGWWAALKDR